VSRYSQLYIERGDRQLDSKRFRVRLSAVFFYELEEDAWGNHRMVDYKGPRIPTSVR
jgi:hypothetical protein